MSINKLYVESMKTYNKIQSDADFIYQNIYLGSVIAANNYQWLKDNKITHVLGLIDYQTKYSDIKYLVYGDANDMPDQNIIQYFKSCFKFIDESLNEGGNILIHCHAGISRSSTIVIAYLMYKYGMNLPEAFEFTKKERPIIHPNYGFVLQLRVFDGLNIDERKYFCS